MQKDASIQHLFAQEAGTVQDILAKQLGTTSNEFSALLNQGSIWVQDQRLTRNISIPAGTYLRIHTDPRRYSVNTIDWMKVIVFEDTDFIVINKPSGVPVHATVDNSVENVLYQLAKVLRHPVHVTQRLDTPTSGLMVIAKTKWFQSQFNSLLKERAVSKTYAALTDQPVPIGLHIHHMLESARAPKVVFATKQDNTQECALEVLSCEQMESGFRSTIKLITGRTHQIRAQFRFLNAPIKGDIKYGSETQSPWPTANQNESIALCSFRLEFKHPAKQGDAAQCLFLLSDYSGGNVKL